MNIIKQMFETPDTPSGKKRLNNLITRLGLGKKIKGDLMKDVVSGELGGGASTDVVKERWVSFDLSALGPVDFKDFTIYYPTKLGYQVLNELCDMFIGFAGIPYTSGDGYAVSGGVMSIGELNNIRKGVYPSDDRNFSVVALKFRETDNNNNIFIDIVGGAPQHGYYGGLGKLNMFYQQLLDHPYWINNTKEERLVLTILLYSQIIPIQHLDEEDILSQLEQGLINFGPWLSANIPEGLVDMMKIKYVNKQEELNKVIDYVTNYTGR